MGYCTIPMTAMGEDPPDGHPQWLRFSSWMEEEGPRHPYVVIEADATLTPWTRRAVRLADHIVLVADATATPEPGPIEVGLLAAHDHDRVRARHSRVLDHPQETRLPRGTQAWLSTRQLDSYHHVRMGDLEDLARVARILSGRAVGLTLGGGGARGYAHIGVAAALRELRIHIDMVGGTSMGSVIAGQVALGLSREEMIDLNPHFLSRKPFAQYTVPMVALLNAGRLQEGMQVAVGNTRIEDLWINYFAVSANLTTTEMVVHDRGPVWEAVRASVSLPGILPPFARGLHLLVDGGVINNLPGGVMRQRGAGSVIAVNVSAANDLRFPPSGLPTEWRIFWNKVLPFARPVPGLAAIVTRTLLLASAHRAALASRTRCRSRAQAAPGRLRPLGVREDPRHRGGRVSLHTRGRLPVERAAGSGMMLIHRERAVDPSCVLARLLRRRRGQDASDRGAGRNHRIEGRPNTGLEWDSRKHMRASYGTRAS